MFKDRSGTSSIEYALIASLISVFAIVAYQQLGDTLIDVWNNVSDNVATVL